MQSLWRCFSKAKEHSVCHDDRQRCSICLDPLGENTATLPCGHTFHGPCLCKALWEKRCCPLCRLTPDDDDDKSDTDDVEEEPVAFVPFSDAMKLARDAAKTDKRTANMFTTLKKWEKKYKDSKKLYIHTKRKLKHLRDVPVEQKVQDYRKKQIDKFNNKHPKLLAKHKESDKMRWHADKQMEKAEDRIAQKYGYIP